MTSSDPPDHADLLWRVARRCDGGSCVRVAASRGMILVGDSKNPDGPILAYTQANWRKFTEAVKKGTFDR